MEDGPGVEAVTWAFYWLLSSSTQLQVGSAEIIVSALYVSLLVWPLFAKITSNHSTTTTNTNTITREFAFSGSGTSLEDLSKFFLILKKTR